MNDSATAKRSPLRRSSLFFAIVVVGVLLWFGLPDRERVDLLVATEEPGSGADLERPVEEEEPPRTAILDSGQEVVGDFRILTFEEVLREGGTAAAMSVAIEKYPRKLEELLASGVFGPDMRLRRTSGEWETPIVKAMRQGTEETFAILMAAGADPNLRNSEGEGALHYAAVRGLMGAVQIFLEAGADPSRAAYDGSTPLRMAVFGAHLDVVEALLQAGASPEHSALWAAASSGSDNIVRRLAAAGALPEGSPGERESMCPIWHASYGGHLSTVRLLLELGAPPTCGASMKPIEIARRQDHSEIVALLESHGAH